MIEQLTISIIHGNDAGRIVKHLNSFINIKSELIDRSTIKVSFDPEKVVAKKIVKVIQSICNPDRRIRKRNIKSIKLLNTQL